MKNINNFLDISGHIESICENTLWYQREDGVEKIFTLSDTVDLGAGSSIDSNGNVVTYDLHDSYRAVKIINLTQQSSYNPERINLALSLPMYITRITYQPSLNYENNKWKIDCYKDDGTAHFHSAFVVEHKEYTFEINEYIRSISFGYYDGNETPGYHHFRIYYE
jgi:hypothetical protein